jgi:mRNA interferase HigB
LRPKWTADVKRRYATAIIVTAERIVFNIKGNAYRLVAAVVFEKALSGSSGLAPTRITTAWT